MKSTAAATTKIDIEQNLKLSQICQDPNIFTCIKNSFRFYCEFQLLSSNFKSIIQIIVRETCTAKQLSTVK